MSVVEDGARELTGEELEERRETCFTLEQSIKTSIARGREAMWELAKALYEFNEESGWIALGYETQGEWLAQPEIGLSNRQFFRAVRLYREMVVQRRIPEQEMAELEPSKVEIVLPSIKNNEATMVQALQDARNLGVRDLREKYIGPQDAPKGRPDAGDPDANGHDASGDIVEGTVVEKAVEEPFARAASAFDSWVDLGGTRAKAARDWQKLHDSHPVFRAIDLINAFMDDEEYEGHTPEKGEVNDAWDELVRSLGLEVETK